MRKPVALCFLVWNEEQGCEADLPFVDQSLFDEVFAIDGGSTDGTVAVLQRYGVPVHRQTVRSLNAAYWQAVETSTCDFLVVFFPKGTISPAILPTFKAQLLNGHDLVIASRMIKGSRNEEDSKWLKPRKWGVGALALCSCLLWRREGPIIWDVLHGVKGFSRRAFYAMNPSRTGVTIDLEMAIRCYKLGLRRREFPVIENPRAYGETKFRIFPTSVKLARCLLAEMRNSAARQPVITSTRDHAAHSHAAPPDA